MRDFKGMKRQRGRNRGGSGGSSGGGGKPQQNANRAFDSNGPDNVKVRGNAQHVFEKYQQLARDANAAGDRVLGENYLQHAEHYFRLLRAIQPNRPVSEIMGRDNFASGYDIDFEDESGMPQGEGLDDGSEQPQPQQQARDDSNRGHENRDRDDRPRDDRPRDDRPRDDRSRGDWQPRENRDRGPDNRNQDNRGQDNRDRDNRNGGDANRGDAPRFNRDRDRNRPRDDRPRDDRPRDDRPRDDRPRDERPRDDRPRDDRPRDDRPRDDRPRAEGEDRPRYDRDRPERDRDRDRDNRDRDPLPVVEPQGAPVYAEERRPVILRDSEGGESHAPAFLQARAEPRPEAAGEEKPARAPRRRKPRTFEAPTEGGGEES